MAINSRHYISESVDVNDLLVCGTSAASIIARKMLFNTIETKLEYLLEPGEEHDVSTREAIEQQLNDNPAAETAEYFDDLVMDIAANIKSYITQGVKVKVREMKYDEEGKLEDVSVDLTWNW